MVWPRELAGKPPTWSLPDGYVMRQFRDSDAAAYIELMAKAGFEGWSEKMIRDWLQRVLPEGFFVVEHEPSGRLVATTMATHNPIPGVHPYGGELGWVAGDPAHAGKGLGYATCAAVTARYLRGGYQRVYLRTDDWRLPAIKTYLKLGYRPLLHTPDMEERWRAVCQKLGMPFQPVR